jgi:UDP-N-acetyl-D-glucosamine dehydrogenase
VKEVVVIGLGYVGLPLALLAAKKGYAVTGIDLDEKKVNLINDKIDPIGEEFIAQNLSATSLVATTKPDSLKTADVIIVCVPTPVKDGYRPDLGPVKSATKMAASHLKQGAVVIIESTINPGVCDEVVIPLIEEESGKKINKDFFVSHCPERINPGDPRWNVENIPRVAGSSSEESLEETVRFYESVVDAHIKPMASLKEAESVKIVENSFRDINIAFVNELARSFEKLGINVKNVIDGAATKPFAFMPHYPSVGVGGHCIPVDPYYLIEYAKGYGFDHEFLSLARSINNSMPEFTVNLLVDALNEVGMSLSESTIAILGLSYKANVADDRESPSYMLIKILEQKGAKVTTFDPYIPKKSTASSIAQVLDSADAAIVAANHKEFLQYDFASSKLKVLIDGKNCLDPLNAKDLPFIYKGIGT